MNQSPQPRFEPVVDTVDEEYEMPCAEALLAGTLALMTGHAQSCCADHRRLMACKVTSNLFVLSQHPLLSPGFQSMLFNLHGRWRQQVLSQAQTQTQTQTSTQAQSQGQSHPLATGTANTPLAVAAISAALNLDQHRVLWHPTPELSQ